MRRYLQLTDCETARQLLHEQAQRLLRDTCEAVPVNQSLGRVLAQPAYAVVSHPNFNAAAMDGVAIMASRAYGAHERNPVTLQRGKDYWPVDTGDCLPAHCNAVVMIEDVVERGADNVEICGAVHPWENVRTIGEDIIVGDMIVPFGRTITPADIGALLAGGVAAVVVKQRLHVGIVPTGSEVVAVDKAQSLQPGEIIDSNSSMLAAMVEQCAAIAKTYDIVPDDKHFLQKAFERAANENDIVVIIAGSSAGRKDYTSELIAQLGTVYIHGLAVKPGKPTIFGEIGGKLVIGMPGYPVAAFAIAREYLQPLLLKHAGIAAAGTRVSNYGAVQATLSRRLLSSLKHQEFVHMKIGAIGNALIATPLNRGAGTTMSLVKADGILIVPRVYEGVEAGRTITVQLLRPLETISRALVCTGSHDIIIDELNNMLAREQSEWTLESAHVGSLGGIMAIKRGEAHIAPVHLLDEQTGEYNVSYVHKYLGDMPCVLVRGIQRVQGLYFRRGEQLAARTLTSIAEHNLVIANRQKGSGTRVLFDYLLQQAGIAPHQVRGYEQELLTHTAVALAVKSGNCDCGMGIESVAKLMDLDFVPLDSEYYDLLIPKQHLQDTRVRQLLAILNSGGLAARLQHMGGYRLNGIEIMEL